MVPEGKKQECEELQQVFQTEERRQETWSQCPNMKRVTHIYIYIHIYIHTHTHIYLYTYTCDVYSMVTVIHMFLYASFFLNCIFL